MEVWLSFVCEVVVGELLILSDCEGCCIGRRGNYSLL